jgi:L-asparagine transporter-like permease
VTATAPPLPRFDQGLQSLVLVSGFVFSAPLVIPVVAAVAAVSAVRPEISPAPRLLAVLVQQRLGADAADSLRADGYPPPWRTAAALLAAILAVGTLVLVVGGRGAAWAFALPAAALAALASVGGVCVGCQLHARRSAGGRR